MSKQMNSQEFLDPSGPRLSAVGDFNVIPFPCYVLFLNQVTILPCGRHPVVFTSMPMRKRILVCHRLDRSRDTAC